MNIRALLVISLTAVAFTGCEKKAPRTAISLDDLPAIGSESYKTDPYIEAAGKLQALGKQVAIEQLVSLSRSPLAEAEERMESKGGPKAEREYEEIWHSSKSDVLDEQRKIGVLCRMLFTPRQGSDFDGPFLGDPTFLGSSKSIAFSPMDPIFKKWPLEPIELVDGIPFLVVAGYIYQGHCDPRGAEQYVLYWSTNCDWSGTRFTAKTKEQKEAALRKLIASPKWEEPLRAWEQDFLKKQLGSL